MITPVDITPAEGENWKGSNAMAFRLRRKEGAATGLRRLVVEEVLHSQAELNDRTSPSETRVHRARRGLKRARTLAAVLDRDLNAHLSDEQKSLRDAGRALSATRDADVVAKTASDLIEGAADDEREPLIRLAAALRERAAAHRGSAVTAEVSRTLGEIAQRLSVARSARMRGRDPLREAMVRLYKRGRHAMELAQVEPTPDHLHEWRKAVKHRMHLTQISRRRYAAATAAIAEALDRLADHLGDDHDLSVLQAIVEKEPDLVGGRADAACLEARLEARRKILQAKAFALGDVLYGARPRVFRTSLDHDAPSSDPSGTPTKDIDSRVRLV